MNDNGAVEGVYETRDDVPGGLRRSVFIENTVAAFGPFADGRIDGFLYGGTVKLNRVHVGRMIIEASREVKDVPEQRAGRSDSIEVEAGVGQENGLQDIVPERATLDGGIGRRHGKRTNRREVEVLLHVRSVATLISPLVDLIPETLVEVEEAYRTSVNAKNRQSDVIHQRIHRHKRQQGHLPAESPRQHWVVDHDGLDIVVVGAVLLQHGIGDVGNIASSIRLASDVDLLASQAKGLHEVLPEAKEFGGSFFLASSFGCAQREPSADGLLNPNHVGQIPPVSRVVYGLGAASILPADGAVLLQKAFKARATGATVQPDGDLIGYIWVGLVADGKQAGIGLANVEVDVRGCASSSVNGELLGSFSLNGGLGSELLVANCPLR